MRSPRLSPIRQAWQYELDTAQVAKSCNIRLHKQELRPAAIPCQQLDNA
jgi:hypothetical protein